MHQFKKVFFKYTSSFKCKFLSLEILLQVYPWVWQWIHKFWKSASSILLTQKGNTNAFQKQVQGILEVCFIAKFLMDSKYILETYKFKLFFSIINFGNQNISKSILAVYFIFRVQKYIWSIAEILAEENTNKSLHNLWSSGLVVRVQVYQTKDPRFKTIRWLLNCPSYHPSKVSLMNIKDSWGLDD